MKHLLLALATLLAAHTAHGKIELVQRISQAQLDSFDNLPSGSTASVAGEPAAPVIHVAHNGRVGVTIKLLTVSQPPLKTRFFAIRGEVSYTEVVGDGYLEMWSWFGEAESFFSRTLAGTGPLGKLSDQSVGRVFCLPFNATGARGTPTKLDMNLTLPGRGNVTLRNLRLEQGDSIEELLGGQTAWWSDRSAGWIGGLAGAVIGCLGSLLEFLSSRGRARGFVVVTACTLAGLGAASVGAGLMALGTLQIPAVAYVLLLVGVLCLAIFPVRLRRYLRQYRQTELRRIDSMDAVGA